MMIIQQQSTIPYAICLMVMPFDHWKDTNRLTHG